MARGGKNIGGHRRWLATGIAALALVVGVVVDVADLITLLPTSNRAERLNGDVNFAVASFVGIGSGKAAIQAAELSASLAERLRSHTDQADGPFAPTVAVAGPEVVGELSMTDRSAQAKLDELNATVGISGSLRSERQATTLLVAIRINRRQLHLAQQVGPVVRQRIQVPGSIDQSVTARIQVRRPLLLSSNGVVGLLLGLGEFESGHPQRARALLLRALREWPTRSGRADLYLLIGHTLAREHRYRSARRYYIRSSTSRPGYRRAQFALAALDFQRGADSCSRRGTDVRLLRSARDTFAHIARVGSPTLRVKSQFALARTDACLSQAGVAHRFGLARAYFMAVVDGYRAGVADVRHEAAESLGWLALIALPERLRGSRGDARIAVSHARELYWRARHLAVDRERRAFFQRQAERLSQRLRIESRGGSR